MTSFQSLIVFLCRGQKNADTHAETKRVLAWGCRKEEFIVKLKSR